MKTTKKDMTMKKTKTKTCESCAKKRLWVFGKDKVKTASYQCVRCGATEQHEATEREQQAHKLAFVMALLSWERDKKKLGAKSFELASELVATEKDLGRATEETWVKLGKIRVSNYKKNKANNEAKIAAAKVERVKREKLEAAKAKLRPKTKKSKGALTVGVDPGSKGTAVWSGKVKGGLAGLVDQAGLGGIAGSGLANLAGSLLGKKKGGAK